MNKFSIWITSRAWFPNSNRNHEHMVLYIRSQKDADDTSKVPSIIEQARYMMKSIRVWKRNMRRELDHMSRILAESPSAYVAMDTEFPGFLYRTPFQAWETPRYRDMKRNVDTMKIIQLGLTFYDHEGVFKGSWEINFREFDPAVDPHESSLQLLVDSGIDFHENMRDGACASYFARLFYRKVLLPYRRRIKWITFHGLYDMGYVVKLLMGRSLPGGKRRFLCRVQNVLGSVYDVKYMMACRGFNQRMGLVKLAEKLNVVNNNAEGRNHQAGYDSLITALSFLKLKRDGMSEEGAAGIFYGLHQCGLRRMLGHYACR